MSNSADPGRFVPSPPPAVVAAAARAEELQRSLLPDGEQTDSQAGVVEDPQNLPVQPHLPGLAPPAPPPPQTPPAATPAPGNRDWERDFNAMKGRYERSDAEARNLKERLDGMEALMARMQTTAPPPPPELTMTRLLTPQEESDYGAEFLQVVGKKAKEELLPELQELRSTVDYLKNGMATVGTTITKSAEERVYDALDQEVGTDWEQLNYDPGFKDWLNQSDPYAGRRRHEMLTEAFGRHDPQRVVKFFKGYLAEAAAVDPQTPQGAPYLTPTPNGSANGKVPLAQFAAPGRAGPAAPQSPADKPVYTRQQIAQFYRDLTAGKWKGREGDAQVIDADIISAGAEGRVR